MYTVRVGCFGAFSMIEQRLAQHIANYFCPLSKPEQPKRVNHEVHLGTVKHAMKNKLNDTLASADY